MVINNYVIIFEIHSDLYGYRKDLYGYRKDKYDHYTNRYIHIHTFVYELLHNKLNETEFFN